MQRTLAIAVCIWVFACPGFTADLSKDVAVASQIQLLDAWIQTQMEYNGLPGLVIGIVHDKEVVWQKAYGHANIAEDTAMETDSIFRIASHSKLFTSIAVLQLRDAGKLRLDDSIVKYLPWFDMQDRHPESPPITIWNLLTHSAGIPRESVHPAWTEYEFPTLEQVKETVSEQETTYRRADRFKYSNLGLSLAGMIVEVVSGRSYKEYVDSEILAPLRMDSTSVGVPSAEHKKRLATGYGRPMPDHSREVMPFVDARAFDPATGLSSNVEDMLRFLAWQMRLRAGGAKEVLSPSTLREMQRVHFLNETWTGGRGLGFGITHTDARDLVGHGGGYPGYRTNTMLSPKERIGVVVFTNGGDGNPNRYVRKAYEWVAPAILKVVKGDARLKKADPSWTRYTGTYRSRGGDRLVMILDDQLVLLSPMSDDPTASKGILVPVEEHIFRLKATGGGPHGELVRFTLDESGNVTRIYVGVNYAERLN